MRPNPLLVVPVVLLTSAAFTGAADPALARGGVDDAAPVIKELTVKPETVVLAARSSGTTAFTVAVHATDATGVDRVTIGLYDPGDTSGRAFRLARKSGSATDGTWTGTLVVQNTARTGAWSIRAFATDLVNNTSNPDTVYNTVSVRLAARLQNFTVKVDPATGQLSASALLQRWKPGRGWRPFTSRAVVLEFMPTAANSYLKVASAVTGADGTVHFDKVSANQSGSWRVEYIGSPGFAPDVSGGRTVTVGGSSTTPGAPAPSSPAG